MRGCLLCVAAAFSLVMTSCDSPLTSNSSSRPSSSPQAQSGPDVWFAPLPPNHGPDAKLGSLDYAGLFAPQAPWQQAAEHVKVFKFYPGFLQYIAGDDELRAAFSDLKRRGIKIAWEAGPLSLGIAKGANRGAPCGKGVEGFGAEGHLDTARRIKSLGGEVSLIAMDEPFTMGTKFTGPGSCQWPAIDVATQIAQFISNVRTVFPNVVVGDIEVDHVAPDELKSWLTAIQATTGEPLPFLHWDIDWNLAGWPARALAAEKLARSERTKFGIIYNGNGADASDLDWLKAAEQRMAMYEEEYGGTPDDVIFQSWVDRPHAVLPETAPDSFTHLIDRYFQTRTRLRTEFGSPGPNGSRQVSGHLTTAEGAPIPGVLVGCTAIPLDGRGVLHRYVLSGITPASAHNALIQLDLSGWAGGTGAIDVHLTSVSYRQGGEARQRVPNANFAQGLFRWGVAPAVRRMVTLGRSGLEIATRGPVRQGYVNSTAFPVTPGSTFRAEFVARVSGSSTRSGQFVVIFGSPHELSRVVLDFAPASSTQTARSGPDGSITCTVPPLGAKHIQISSSWSGDATRWPAFDDAND